MNYSYFTVISDKKTKHKSGIYNNYYTSQDEKSDRELP